MKRGEDGFFQLEKDAEAVREFMAEVAAKTKRFDTLMERIRWLVDYEFYYGEVESQYDVHQLVGIHDICDSYEFRFSSFMAASKFYKDYALQTNDKSQYLETYAQHVAIVALYLGQGNYALAERLARSMMEQRLQPATPTFLNAGRARRGEMATCMQLSKIGGGVAVNLSKLRGRGEPIKGVEGAAKGIMPVLKLMEDAFSYADQMGQRKGSGAAYYNIFGWDIAEFLDTKKINADEKARLKTLSIGLIVPRKFYELARDNRPLHVFAQHSVFKAYGAHLDDMDITEMYEELLANPAVKKRELMSARDMLTKIATTQLESGYPYIMNRDNANEGHPLTAIGSVKMSNLC